MLIPRVGLGLLYIYLGLRHLLIPETFRSTLELPANNGIILRDILVLPLTNETLFIVVRFIAVVVELIVGGALLVGFLLRLLGIISTGLLFIITISLIPNWFMLVLHGIPFIVSIPLIFINSNIYAPAEKYIPKFLRKWQAR